MRDVKYMREITNNNPENEVDKILNIIEESANNGKSYVKVYIGSSDEDASTTFKRKFLTQELEKLGFDVDSSFEVEWRFLISNLTKWYLEINW